MEHCQTRSSVVQAPLEHQKGPKEPSSYKLDFIPYERGAVNSLSTALGGVSAATRPKLTHAILCAPPSSRPRAFTHQRLRLRLLPPIRHGAAASKD